MSNDLTLTENKLTYQLPDKAQLDHEADLAFSAAMLFVIQNDDDVTRATEDMNKCSKRAKELEKMRKETTKPIDDAKKQVMAVFKPATEHLNEAVSFYKDSIGTYITLQQKRAEEAQKLAQEKAKEQKEAISQAIEQAKEKGDSETVATLETVANTLPVEAPTVAPKVKVEGATVRKKIKGRVTDLKAFLLHIAEHEELQSLIEVKQGELDRFLAASSGSIAMPGIEVYEETIIATRG